MKINEILEIKKLITIDEKKDEETLNIAVPFIQADKKTLNGRIYSKTLLTREVDRIQKAIEKRQFLGTGDHSPSGLSDIATASHIVKKVWLDSSGKGWMEATIVGTTRGKNIMTLIKQGASLGVSMRGFGDISPNGTVQNSYRLLGIDIVTNPSYEGGTFSKDNVFESLDFSDEKGKDTIEEALEKAESFIQSILETNYSTAVDEYGYGDGLEAYKKEKRPLITAVYLTQEGYFESTEQALEYLGEKQLARKISSQSTQEKVTPAQVRDEALAAGADPVEYAKKINEMVDKNLEREETVEEDNISFLMAEALDGGINWGNLEERKKFIEAHKKIRKTQTLSLEERAEIVAKEHNTTVERVKDIWAFDRKEKTKENLRKRAIATVNRDLLISGSTVSKEVLHEMVQEELKALLGQQKK